MRFAPPPQERPAERPPPRFEPLAEPIAAPPRRLTPAEDSRPTVLYMPAAANAVPAAPREDRAAPGTQVAPVPVEPPAQAPQTVRMWSPERGPEASSEPSRRTELLYPWKEEPPAVPRRPSRQIPSQELDAVINRSWPPLAKEAETLKFSTPLRGPEPFEEPQACPWPELPEPPCSDSTEAQAALRHWERLSRLDREQRGE